MISLVLLIKLDLSHCEFYMMRKVENKLLYEYTFYCNKIPIFCPNIFSLFSFPKACEITTPLSVFEPTDHFSNKKRYAHYIKRCPLD